MPANLYGVANCPGIPVASAIIGSANLVCPANAETNVIASAPLIAPTQGFFYASVMGVVSFSIGATAPSTVTVGLRFTGGSDITNYIIGASELLPNTALTLPVAFYTPAQTANWLAPGSVLNVSLLPQAQPVTALQGSVYAYFGLLRAPDQ